jgi:hypothetical protein
LSNSVLKTPELTLVAHTTNEFQRVPGLKVEDWMGFERTNRTSRVGIAT